MKTNNRNKNSLPATIDIADMGKIPPNAIDLEEGVIGALLLNKKAIYEIINILREDSFYKEENRLLFRVITYCQVNGIPIDILTVTQTARQLGLLEPIGGAFYITSLTNRVASTAHIETHSRIIEQQAIKRRVIQLSHTLIQKAYDETTDCFDLLNDVAQFLNRPEFTFSSTDPAPVSRLKKAMEAINNAQINEGPSGLTLGRPKIDNSIRGFQNGDYWVIAGRPGMGKTAVAMAIGRLISEKYGSIFWKQLEMSDEQTALREISSHTGFPVAKLKGGKMNNADYSLLQTTVNEMMKKSKIYVDTDPFMDIGNLKASCTRAVNEYKAKMIIIDYLQLAEGIDDDRNREQTISRISRTIKLTAKSLGVPIIALAQLSRAVESRPNKRPQLSDLRESGSIEQDADGVIFLYRPEYYDIKEIQNEMGEMISSTGKIEMITAKNRQGPTGSILEDFDITTNRFKDESFNQVPEIEYGNRITPNPKIEDNGDLPF